MKTTLRLAILALVVACASLLAVPRVTSVEPDAVAPGGTAVAKGTDLAENAVDTLYLTAGGTDIALKITEQTAESITFEIPESIEMKRYRLMILTAGAGAAYMEQPIALEVVDAETAKARAEEEDVEVEIIDAAPEEVDDGNN